MMTACKELGAGGKGWRCRGNPQVTSGRATFPGCCLTSDKLVLYPRPHLPLTTAQAITAVKDLFQTVIRDYVLPIKNCSSNRKAVEPTLNNCTTFTFAFHSGGGRELRPLLKISWEISMTTKGIETSGASADTSAKLCTDRPATVEEVTSLVSVTG